MDLDAASAEPDRGMRRLAASKGRMARLSERQRSDFSAVPRCHKQVRMARRHEGSASLSTYVFRSCPQGAENFVLRCGAKSELGDDDQLFEL